MPSQFLPSTFTDTGVPPASASSASGTLSWTEQGTAPAVVTSALILNCNSDGSTTWTDSGQNGHAVSPQGSPTQVAAAAKFGAAGYRGGASKYFRIADATSLRPRTAAFVVACWAKATSITASHVMWTKGTNTTDRMSLVVGASGNLVWLGGGGAILSTANGIVTADSAYHHYQYARMNGYGYLWQDGLLVATSAGVTRGADATDYNVAGFVAVGSDREQTGGTSDWIGDIDAVEFRVGVVPRGVVVVSGVPNACNFTVPTSEPT